MFSFRDWVRDRYSTDFSIDLSALLAVEPDHFRAMLPIRHYRTT